MQRPVANQTVDIIKMREKLFPNIPSRHHRILKLYTYGSNEHELLAYGEVDYEHHHGGKADTHWASKYSVKQVGNELKFAHVHIVLVLLTHSVLDEESLQLTPSSGHGSSRMSSTLRLGHGGRVLKSVMLCTKTLVYHHARGTDMHAV